MPNMLTEKRNELVNKLNALEAARQADIDAKVAAYRKSLEETAPMDDILKVKNVIAALDEVIKYESAQVAKVTLDKESVMHTAEARPGMSSVFTPTR